MENEPLAALEIQRIVTDWYGKGLITADDQALLKAEYLRQLGVETCTECPNFWNNVQLHFRLFLRSLNLDKSMITNKYIIPLHIGSIYVAGVGLLVNPGVKVPGTVELTDSVAEDLLAQFPEMGKEQIVLNPDYDASAEKEKAQQKAEAELKKAQKAADDKAKKEAAEAKKTADAKTKKEAADAKKLKEDTEKAEKLAKEQAAAAAAETENQQAANADSANQGSSEPQA